MHDPDPSDPSRPICWFCGEPEELEIGEVWLDSNFTLHTCCEGLLASVSAGISDDPAWGRDLLRRLGAEALTGHRLRRVSDGEGCHPMLDWHLDLHPVAFAQARAFIARRHAHCPPPVAHRWCHAVWSGRQIIGVVTAGNPVARAYMGRGIAELSRLCVRRDVAPLLVWNAASMLYGAACRSAERAGFGRMVTYTRADEEDGGSLVAAGFVRDGRVRGRRWHGGRRRRGDHNAGDKVRWSRTLRPKPVPAPTPPRPTLPGPVSDPRGQDGLRLSLGHDPGLGFLDILDKLDVAARDAQPPGVHGPCAASPLPTSTSRSAPSPTRPGAGRSSSPTTANPATS